MNSKIIFGINMSHDTACAAVIDGEVKVAIEEERLNGVKHCDGKTKFGRIIPFLSIHYCCDYLGITPSDVDLWVVNAVYAKAPEIARLQMLGIPPEKILEVERPGHHMAHAYSAFYPSGFDEAAVLILDVNGGLIDNSSKKENYSIYYGEGNKLTPVVQDLLSRGELSIAEVYTIYSAILLLSPVEDGDYGNDDSLRSGGKLMGYAAHYFNEELRKEKLKAVREGLFKKNTYDFSVNIPNLMEDSDTHLVVMMEKLVKYLKSLGKVSRIDSSTDYERAFGWSLRAYVTWKYRETSLRDFDNVKFGYEGQLLLEEGILKMANLAYEKTKSKNLCLAGGSMLNVVACNRILKETPFEKIFIQPGANDGGNAIGCALYGYYKLLGGENLVYNKKTYLTSLGKQYKESDIEKAVARPWGLPFRNTLCDEDKQIEILVHYLKENEVVCVFKGRSEFGPRALGNRSFLASPSKADMLTRMNEIKEREWYRPVAPIIPVESLHEYFDAPFDESPFMTINAHCKEITKKMAPSICHIDGSARVQTVSEDYNPFITKLLRRFAEVSGLPPILINTSFNIGGPIVETPDFAIDTFLKANYDVRALLLENYVLELDNFNEKV